MIFSGIPHSTIFGAARNWPITVFGCIWLYLGVLLALPNMVEWCIPEKIIKRHINLRVIGPPSKKQQKQISTQFMLKITSFGGKN